MEKIRFDLEFEAEELKVLDQMMKKCNRNRKNMCETLVLIAIETFKSGCNMMELDKLGVLNIKDENKVLNSKE